MDRIPLFPLHTVLFPQTDFGLHVFEDRYRLLVAECLDSGGGFGVVLIRRGRDVGGPADPHPIGTLAGISAHARLPDGRYLIEVEGTRRFRIHDVHNGAPYLQAEVQFLTEPIGDFGSVRARSNDVERLMRRYATRMAGVRPDLPVSPLARSYAVASALRIDPPEKQALLEAASAEDRLTQEVGILQRELALLDLVESRPGGSGE